MKPPIINPVTITTDTWKPLLKQLAFLFWAYQGGSAFEVDHDGTTHDTSPSLEEWQYDHRYLYYDYIPVGREIDGFSRDNEVFSTEEGELLEELIRYCQDAEYVEAQAAARKRFKEISDPQVMAEWIQWGLPFGAVAHDV